ncbi:MAG TPA: hypothetical protein VF535_12790 [Allosphingosinicella sp.]
MFLLALLLGAAPDAAALTKIGISGRTAAPDSTVAQAALNEVRGFAAGDALKCGEMGGAEASLMPKGWVPADPNFRIGPKKARYERWDIKLCGKEVPFLVVFWKDKKAGPQFQVAHPFPAGPAKAAKP